MAKKQKKSLYIAYSLMSLILAIVVMAMMFVDGAAADSSKIVGYDMAFGGELTSIKSPFSGSNIADLKLNFNTFLTLSFLLPLVLSLVALFLALGGNRKGLIFVNLFVFLVFVAAAVGFFTSVNTSSGEFTLTILGVVTKSTSTLKEAGYELGIGSILAGSFATLGAFSTFTTTLVMIVKK
ncbi:MAG: hypothetical protein ACOX28_04165 [Bacilli bacterium]|jgi:flagellar basal body-associated protein FliL